MTIKDVEQQTGLPRSNIRFYEKENLIKPSRNSINGYRDYSEKDVETIKKIVFLRTIGIPIDDIRNIMDKKISLREEIEKQNTALNGQITELNQAKAICERILMVTDVSYEELQVEKYATDDLEGYWNGNPQVFKLDSVSFLYVWGSFIIWALITGLCLSTSILFYKELPSQIPVQWSNGVASSLVVFCSLIGRGFLNFIHLGICKEYCSCFVCRYRCTYWYASGRTYKNEFKS